MNVPMLNLHWEERNLLINLLKEIKYKILKIQINVLTVGHDTFKN